MTSNNFTRQAAQRLYRSCKRFGVPTKFLAKSCLPGLLCTKIMNRHPEKVVLLNGQGLMESHGAKFPATYAVEADLESRVWNVLIAETNFETPSPGTSDIFLHLDDGRVVPIRIGEEGRIEADGPIQKGWPDRGWRKDTDPFPLDQNYVLTVWCKGQVIQQSTHPSIGEARRAYGNIRVPVDFAEIRSASGDVIKLP